MNRGRSQRARGYRAEKRVEAALGDLGARRNVMSGTLGGEFAGDLRVSHPIVQRVEVKHRAAGWPVLRRWLKQGDAHALVLEEGAVREPLVVVTLSTFTRLLQA